MSSGTDAAIAARLDCRRRVEPLEQRRGERSRRRASVIAARQVVGGEQHALAAEPGSSLRVSMKLRRNIPAATSTDGERDLHRHQRVAQPAARRRAVARREAPAAGRVARAAAPARRRTTRPQTSPSSIAKASRSRRPRSRTRSGIPRRGAAAWRSALGAPHGNRGAERRAREREQHVLGEQQAARSATGRRRARGASPSRAAARWRARARDSPCCRTPRAAAAA